MTTNTTSTLSLRAYLPQIHGLLADIEAFCADGDFIFRGEAKKHSAIDTGIRRVHRELMKQYDITADRMQDVTLKEAKKYTALTDPHDILSELQHYGANTNLLDFSEDYRVALYFACEAHPDNEGQLIICRRDKYPSWRPTIPLNRVITQRSIFVQPPTGRVDPDKVIGVPVSLKQPFLKYLSAFSGLSISSVYNDLHGFIRWQKAHDDALASAIKALALTEKLPESKDEEEMAKLLTEVAKHLEDASAIDAFRGLFFFVQSAVAFFGRDFEAVLEYANSAIANEYDDPLLDFLRGGTLALTGKFDEGRAELERALQRTRESGNEGLEAAIIDILCKMDEPHHPE